MVNAVVSLPTLPRGLPQIICYSLEMNHFSGICAVRLCGLQGALLHSAVPPPAATAAYQRWTIGVVVSASG